MLPENADKIKKVTLLNFTEYMAVDASVDILKSAVYLTSPLP